MVDQELHGEHGSQLTIEDQCKLLKISRAAYYDNKNNDEQRQSKRQEKNRIAVERADIVFNEWLTHEAYGYLKMSMHLRKKGYCWAREKRVRLLYKQLGIEGLRPVFKTTKAGKAPYGKFPYLLRHKIIRYPNQVMATDITYIKTKWGMMYFTAVIDLFSRKILSWRLSNSMAVDFCLECVKEAFDTYGVPAIFNTDCGSQYTSAAFVEQLQSYGVAISMDGIGRCKDNIFVERTWRTLKYEWVFLRDYDCEEDLRRSLGEFVEFFNGERIHQGLEYMTPNEVYEQGMFPENKLICKNIA